MGLFGRRLEPKQPTDDTPSPTPAPPSPTGPASAATPGPLFTSLRHQVLTDESISGEAVARMLRARARAAGMSPERITGHSLRAGHATTAAAAGSH